jgi:hypothetical protein
VWTESDNPKQDYMQEARTPPSSIARGRQQHAQQGGRTPSCKQHNTLHHNSLAFCSNSWLGRSRSKSLFTAVFQHQSLQDPPSKIFNITFPADDRNLNTFLNGNAERFHSILWCLLSVSQWQIHISSTARMHLKITSPT